MIDLLTAFRALPSCLREAVRNWPQKHWGSVARFYWEYGPLDEARLDDPISDEDARGLWQWFEREPANDVALFWKSVLCLGISTLVAVFR